MKNQQDIYGSDDDSNASGAGLTETRGQGLRFGSFQSSSLRAAHSSPLTDAPRLMNANAGRGNFIVVWREAKQDRRSADLNPISPISSPPRAQPFPIT